MMRLHEAPRSQEIRFGRARTIWRSDLDEPGDHSPTKPHEATSPQIGGRFGRGPHEARRSETISKTHDCAPPNTDPASCLPRVKSLWAAAPEAFSKQSRRDTIRSTDSLDRGKPLSGGDPGREREANSAGARERNRRQERRDGPPAQGTGPPPTEGLNDAATKL